MPTPNGFDFLAGQWRVRHRRVSRTTGAWEEFDGTASHRGILGGLASIEDHMLAAPSGIAHAVALRAYDPDTGLWAIWWLDGRLSSGPLDPPVVGGFDNGVGEFYSDYLEDGKPMRVRFRWSDITADSARWEQSYSSDGGATWTLDWVMNFHRVDPHPAAAGVSPEHRSDFDFLRGDWRVTHRFLRTNGGSDWLIADGTASHVPLMAGRSNLEEHTINAPSGVFRALALRSYDPEMSHWSVWWLDGRIPRGDLGPPIRGSFAGGLGTFFGDTTVNGRRTRVRFSWSDITESSARWEQAYSPHAGAAWETNWIMEFRR